MVMKPVPFKQQTVVYAKDQSEYNPLPAYKDSEGLVISCWKLSWRERIKLLVTGRVWVMVLTFNNPLQPMSVDTNNPWGRK
jgi:hypothetical protein